MTGACPLSEFYTTRRTSIKDVTGLVAFIIGWFLVGAASWRVLADGFEAGDFVGAMLKFATIVFIGAALCGALGLGVGAIIGQLWEITHRRRHPPRESAEPAASRAPAPPPPAPRISVRVAAEPSVLPYLVVQGAPALITFLHDAFDARENSRVLRADGSLLHAEVRIANGVVMIAEANAERPATTAAVYVRISDPDAVITRALAAGATLERALAEDADSGDRAGAVRDPSGIVWWIAAPLSATSQ